MNGEKKYDREQLLREIEARMRKADIFYQDIWERILQTDLHVLKEIADSNFENEVLRMKRQ